MQESVDRFEQFLQDGTDEEKSALFRFFKKVQNGESTTKSHTDHAGTGIPGDNSHPGSVKKEKPVGRVSCSKKHGGSTDHFDEMLKTGETIDMNEMDDEEYEQY